MWFLEQVAEFIVTGSWNTRNAAGSVWTAGAIVSNSINAKLRIKFKKYIRFVGT
jgi:hypothetical protein